MCIAHYLLESEKGLTAQKYSTNTVHTSTFYHLMSHSGKLFRFYESLYVLKTLFLSVSHIPHIPTYIVIVFRFN